MKKLIIDIAITQNIDINRRNFNILCGVIAQTYSIYQYSKIEGLNKVFINLTDNPEIRDIVYDFKGFFGVCHIDRIFNFNKHFEKPLKLRKKEILDTLHHSILMMCDKFNFDKTPFDTAYQKVIENNFEYRNVMNKMASAKNRQHKAGIEVDLKEDGAQINVLFTNKNSQPVVRRELIKLKADYYFINQLINKGKWLDNERYMVSDKNEVANFIAQLNSDKVELQICPRNTTTEQVLERIEGLKA